MNAVRTSLATLTAAAALVVSAATGAHADDASIAHVERTDAGFELSVDVPQGSQVDLDGVEATINGESYVATARLGPRIQRTTILAMDTSDSMTGARFDAAKVAAATFLDDVPDDVAVGIVTFDAVVDEALAPTTDRNTARAVVDGLELRRGTRLYDAVGDAVKLAGAEGQRRVLVLSDGSDTDSDTTLDDLTTTIGDADVTVDVFALEQSGNLVALGRIAGQEGRVINSDATALAAAFSVEADVLQRQIGVTISTPDDVTADQASISVTLTTSTGAVTAGATVPGVTTDGASEASDPVPGATGGSGPHVPQWFMYAGVVVFGVGLVLALLMLVPRAAVAMTAEERIATYTTGQAHATGPTKLSRDDALTQVKKAAAGVLRRNEGFDARITERLDGAGSQLNPSEWLLLQAAIFVISGAVGLLLGRGNLVIGLIFLVLGAIGPWVYLGFRRSRRRKAFNASLPDTLQLMSGSLSAGLSLAQSVDTIVREGQEPVASEFKRVLVETRLGVSLEDAFAGVAERFDSKDFGWVVMAIKIQRQVGGNLAELLDTVADTMREREYVRRQVASLAAEGKLSAIVLAALPPLFVAYLFLAKRDYIMIMFTDIRGIVMMLGATLWLSVGVFWMSRLVKVEV